MSTSLYYLNICIFFGGFSANKNFAANSAIDGGLGSISVPPSLKAYHCAWYPFSVSNREEKVQGSPQGSARHKTVVQPLQSPLAEGRQQQVVVEIRPHQREEAAAIGGDITPVLLGDRTLVQKQYASTTIGRIYTLHVSSKHFNGRKRDRTYHLFCSINSFRPF